MHTCRVNLQVDGLQDDCSGCTDLAANPIRDLDETMLCNLVVLAVRRDRLYAARSDMEAVASATVLTTLEQLGHLAEVAPEAVTEYLQERWRLAVSIANPRAEELAAARARLEATDA